MHRLSQIISLAAFLATAGPVHAASGQDRDDCRQRADVELSIAACTRIIADRNESARDRAVAFYRRGNSYRLKNDVDLAIADYDEALRLHPALATYTLIVSARAEAYDQKRSPEIAADLQKRAYDLALEQKRKHEAALKEPDHDRAIADYSRTIELNPGYSVAFASRGRAYASIGDFDHAILDYDEAIRLNPKSAYAFLHRGIAYDEKGDHGRALADLDEALRLRPDYVFAHRARGVLHFTVANYDAAVADLTRALQQRPDDGASMLWLYLARMRSGAAEAASELDHNAGGLTQVRWPYPVVELFCGRSSAPATLMAAGTPEQWCEGRFYVGQWHLLRNDRTEATALLELARDTCPKDAAPLRGAQAELKRLGR